MIPRYCRPAMTDLWARPATKFRICVRDRGPCLRRHGADLGYPARECPTRSGSERRRLRRRPDREIDGVTKHDEFAFLTHLADMWAPKGPLTCIRA